MNTALYELANLRDLLDVELDAAGGELTPELEAQLDALDLAASEKIERVALYIREQEATARAIREEEDRVKARRVAHEKAAAGLKGYLHRQMERLGRPKMDGLLVSVSVQQNPPALVGELSQEALRNLAVIDPTAVTHTPETWALNRRVILDGYKNGGAVPEGLTVTRGSSLRIR